MKWMLLSLLSINLILFIVNLKGREESIVLFEKVEGVNEITLLSEVSLSGKKSIERCYVISGFEGVEQIEQTKNFLNKRNVSFTLVNKEEELASVFWVYVRNDGEQQARQILRKQGIDSYVISDGELKGMLSAGLFENIDLARGLVKRLESAGLTADIYERKKQKNNISLEIRSDQIKDKAMLMKAFTEDKINISEIKEFFCKGIASEK